MSGALTRHHETGSSDSCLHAIPVVSEESSMYRKRLVCTTYAQMNITADQTRRLMYIVGNEYAKDHPTFMV
jgi:hypothetical protein